MSCHVDLVDLLSDGGMLSVERGSDLVILLRALGCEVVLLLIEGGRVRILALHLEGIRLKRIRILQFLQWLSPQLRILPIPIWEVGGVHVLRIVDV